MIGFTVTCFFPLIMGSGFGILTWMLSAFKPESVSEIMAKHGGKFYLFFLSLPFFVVFAQSYFQRQLEAIGISLPQIGSLNPWISVFISLIVAVILGISLYYNELYLSVFIYKAVKNVHPAANKISEGGSASLTRYRYPFWGYLVLSLFICIAEELIWRGFLLFFLIDHFHFHAVWALLVASILFGGNHLFFGLRNVLLKTIDGIAWGVFFLLTSSLLIPLVSHLIFQCFVWRRLLRQTAMRERVA